MSKKRTEKSVQTMRSQRAVVKKMTPDEVYSHIGQYSREPFQNILMNFLLAAPDPQDIAAFAKKSPDRYAQSLAITAKLAGFNETIQHNHLHVDLTQLSDSQLEDFIATHSTSLPAASVSLPTASQSLETLNAEPEVINVTPDKE